MQFVKVVGGLLQQSQRAARSLERSVQEVVEVLQPGPLGATAARWDAQRRADAELAVQQALDRWQAIQQRQQQQQQQTWLQPPRHHSDLAHAQDQGAVQLEQDLQQQQQRQQQQWLEAPGHLDGLHAQHQGAVQLEQDWQQQQQQEQQRRP